MQFKIMQDDDRSHLNVYTHIPAICLLFFYR